MAELNVTPTNRNGNTAFAITIIGVLFFVFGFITWANSQLIPYLRIACELSLSQSYLVATAFLLPIFLWPSLHLLF